MASVPEAARETRIANLSQGYRGDLPPHKIPPGSSPSLRNVVVANGQVRSLPGWQVVSDTYDTKGAIIHLTQWQALPYVTWDPIVAIWGPHLDSGFKPGFVRIYDPLTPAWYDITPSDYAVQLWSDDYLFLAPPSTCISPDQYLILTNTAGVWSWEPEEADDPLNPGAMVTLDGLSDAGIDSAFTCASFGPHLILGAVQVDGQWYGERYYWSQTNNSKLWTIGFNEDTEIESLAGFADLPFNQSQQSVVIIRMEPLRDYLLIYTKEMVFSLEFVGSPFIWVRRPLQNGFGLRSWDSIVNMGDRHIVAAWDGDIYEFNGVEKQSIGAPIRDYLNRAVKGADGGYIRGFRRFKDDSAVFYFSTTPETPLQPDTAVVWNTKERAWTIEDFPFMVGRNVTTEGVDGNLRTKDGYRSIQSLTGTIDDLPTTYSITTIDELSQRPVVRNQDQISINQEIMGGYDGVLYKRDGWTKNGSDMTCRWRTHVFGGGGEQDTARRVSHWCNVFVGALNEGLGWLEEEALNAAAPTSYTITVNLYTANRPNVDWDSLSVSQSRTLTIGASPTTDPWLPFRVNARWAQVEITATSTYTADPEAFDDRPWALEEVIAYAINMGRR